MRLVVIIVNPVAGRSRPGVIDGAAAFLRPRAVRVEVCITGARGDAEILSRRAVEAGADLVVAAGGDGTINEVANGLTGSTTTLGIIPLGTANVLALETGIPTDPERACRLLIEGTPRMVHPGLIGTRRFLLMAGAGLDAEAIYRTSLSWKERIGKGAYVASGLRALVAGHRPELSVSAAGVPPVRGSGVIVGRSRLYGGRLSVTPGASLREPLLQVCVFRGRGRLDMIRYAWGVIRGVHPTYRDVALFKADRVAIASDERVHVHADGDVVGVLPVDICVAPDALRVVLPDSRTAGAPRSPD